MMTIEEKAKAYDHALEVLHKYDDARIMFTQDLKEEMFPELKENEDEMIRKEIIEYFKHYSGGDNISVRFPKWIAYLEKQKAKERLDRMAPIYNDKESFESALEKAWKYYNESASRKVDSFEDDYIECVFSKGFREGFLYKEKQKEQKPILEVFGFKIGDAVRLKDGDGRKHIIKSFEEVEGLHGPNFYHVEFEDNSARDSIYPGEEYPNGYYTQMEKIEEEQKPIAHENNYVSKPKTSLEILKHYLVWAENSEEDCPYTWKELAAAIKDGISALEQKPVINNGQQECPYKDLALVKDFFGKYKRKCKLFNKICDSKECEQWAELQSEFKRQ